MRSERSLSSCIVVLVLSLALSGVTSVAVGQYPRQGVRLLSRIALADMPGAPASGAGCASYVAPSGQEYAIMGVRNGTLIVRITQPEAPVIVTHIPGLSSTWHEMTVCGEYLYSVADSVDQGMQIIDLRQVDQGLAPLVGTYHGLGLNRVHTIQANPISKTLYLNGSNRGFVALDISNPAAPVEVGRWTTRYVHDSQIRTFTSGPYAGREIAYLCCGGAGLYILDVTNKAAMTVLGNLPYLTGSYYSHSGQLTADGRHFLINDEFDERNGLVPTCTTHVIDVSNLANPTYAGRFENPINVIDHNTELRGNWMYLAAYRAGLRVYNVSNPLSIRETGYFDTYPSGQGYAFEGAWGTAAGYPSGNAIISDINRGLFVLDPTEATGRGAPLLSAVATLGTPISGSLASLRDLDGKVYRFLAGRGLGKDRIGVVLEVQAQTSYSPATTFDLTYAGSPVERVVVELRRWSTGVFVKVGEFPITAVQPLRTLFGLSGAEFVDATGRISARFTLDAGSARTRKSSLLDIDQIKFGVVRP